MPKINTCSWKKKIYGELFLNLIDLLTLYFLKIVSTSLFLLPLAFSIQVLEDIFKTKSIIIFLFLLISTVADSHSQND